jgi:hypothetical protein
MIRRNTWILIVILAALVGLGYYLKDQKAKTEAKATPTLGSLVLFNSSEGQPGDIKIEDSSGNSVEVLKNSNNVWVVKAPKEAAADQASVEAAATQVGTLHILSNVLLGPDVVGLDKPSYIITITFPGNKTHKLTVGSATPIQDGYYSQMDGGKIQIIGKDGIDALLALLNTPPYLATATPAESPTPTTQVDTPTPIIDVTPSSTVAP